MSSHVSGPTIETPFIREESFASEQSEPLSDLMENTIESIEAYAREKPWTFGLWMMGIGFVVGWKLKIW